MIVVLVLIVGSLLPIHTALRSLQVCREIGSALSRPVDVRRIVPYHAVVIGTLGRGATLTVWVGMMEICRECRLNMLRNKRSSNLRLLNSLSTTGTLWSWYARGRPSGTGESKQKRSQHLLCIVYLYTRHDMYGRVFYVLFAVLLVFGELARS